ncbi:MAG: AMP-binding protein [Fibrobacteraceae bacterium]
MQKLFPNSLPALFMDTCNSPEFSGWYMRRNGLWESYSPERLKQELFYITLALNKLGIGEGKSLGIAAKSSPEWLIADFACEICHGTTVPLFPNITQEHFDFQCTDSQVDVLAIDSPQNLDNSIHASLSRFNLVICFNSEAQIPQNGIRWRDLLTEGEILAKEEGTTDWFRFRIQSIQPDDLFSVIYTSGSTGRPKGAELSHRNMLSLLESLDPQFETRPETDVALSVLPLAHVFERMVLYFYILKKIRVYFADDPKNAGKICKEIRPTVITLVPRILERICERLYCVENNMHGLSRKLTHQAIRFAKMNVPGKSPLLRQLYDKLVYKKMREALGDNFNWIVSGSCALDKTTYRFLSNLGFPIYEGYGLTECTPVVSVNSQKFSKAGSVGKILPHLQVKFGEKNEVLVKGDSVFHGYRNMPDKNQVAFTEDGFFHTGDQGIIDHEGYLFLTGRIKEIFKTSTGKYVSPVPIELELMRHPLIEAAMIEANGRKFVSAIIFLGYRAAIHLLHTDEKHFNSQEAIKSPRIQEAVAHHIQMVNQKLNHWEQIQKWVLVADELSIEKGLITPTFKLRRSKAEILFKDKIEAMYR